MCSSTYFIFLNRSQIHIQDFILLLFLQAQATKFGSYLVSSKYTSSVADVHYLVSATNALATNQVTIAT